MESTTLRALGSALLFTAAGLTIFFLAASWIRRWPASELVIGAALLGAAIVIAATLH